MKKSIFFISFILLIIGETAFAQTATLSGFVTDSTNGESLIGANIYFQDLPIGISSNEHGYFILQSVPAGKHILVVNYLGYHSYRQPLDIGAGEKKFLNIMLRPQALEGEAVLVSAERLTSEREIQLSQVELSTRTIRSAPQLGEADLFRTIQALPGVVSESDFSTGLVVRGGNTDQNLIMLDGITVYNPSHMGGLFSNFLLDAIKDARFIKGGFPAEYGGRMSSVLNIISKAGNSKHAAGSAGVSMLSSRFSFEAPLQNGALLLAGRRTYFDKALKLIGKEFPYYFYDFQGSLFQDFSANDRLTLSGYFGNDVLDWDKLSFN
ncbi:MAG TPA: TonB-dependent receptor, partial [Caldithrix sp.]|nr:TonB-dependent receptor [Caldithrix sp.]